MCGIFFSCSGLRNPQKGLRYKHTNPYLWFVLYSKWSFADINWVSVFYMFGIKQEKKPFFNNREAKLTFHSLCKVTFVQSSLQCCVLVHLWIASGTHHKKEPNFSLRDLAQCTSQGNSKNSQHGSGSVPAAFSAEGCLGGHRFFFIILNIKVQSVWPRRWCSPSKLYSEIRDQ